MSLLTELDACYTEHRRGITSRPARRGRGWLDLPSPFTVALSRKGPGIACMVRGMMAVGFGVVGLTAVAVLMVACGSGRSETTSDVPAGREIFLTQCYGCHTLGAAGTPIAPDLSRVGARLSREQIERRLRDPRTHEPTARMPKLDLSEAQIQALATYLSELR